MPPRGAAPSGTALSSVHSLVASERVRHHCLLEGSEPRGDALLPGRSLGICLLGCVVLAWLMWAVAAFAATQLLERLCHRPSLQRLQRSISVELQRRRAMEPMAAVRKVLGEDATAMAMELEAIQRPPSAQPAR